MELFGSLYYVKIICYKFILFGLNKHIFLTHIQQEYNSLLQVDIIQLFETSHNIVKHMVYAIYTLFKLKTTY